MSSIRLLGPICGVILACCGACRASLNSVDWVPEVPTSADLITLRAKGIMPSGPVRILESRIMDDGFDLRWDLELWAGPLTVMTEWSHMEEVGPLPPGTYQLTVRAMEEGMVIGQVETSLTVVPEPSAAACAAMGAAILARRTARRR